MSDDSVEVVERTQSGVFIALLGFAVLASAGSLIWAYTLENRLEKSQTALLNAQQQNDKLAESLNETKRQAACNLRDSGSERGAHSSANWKPVPVNSSSGSRPRPAAWRRNKQPRQAEAQKQIGAVSSDVSSVKTDVGGVKTDVAATKTELANTENQLKRVTGDLGVTSGLVATNGKELEILKHKGDRNYYDLNLTKGAKPTPISGITVSLKKADTKHSKYTLLVESDDKKIEKKDKNLDEPIQFYTGKDKLLYELVINTINKNQVIGYLATPKNAPTPDDPSAGLAGPKSMTWKPRSHLCHLGETVKEIWGPARPPCHPDSPRSAEGPAVSLQVATKPNFPSNFQLKYRRARSEPAPVCRGVPWKEQQLLPRQQNF